METVQLIKITTNIGDYDVQISKEELESKISSAKSGDKVLTLDLGEIKTHWHGKSWDDKVKINLNLEHVNILSIEEHNMTLNEVKQSKKGTDKA